MCLKFQDSLLIYHYSCYFALYFRLQIQYKSFVSFLNRADGVIKHRGRSNKVMLCYVIFKIKLNYPL